MLEIWVERRSGHAARLLTVLTMYGMLAGGGQCRCEAIQNSDVEYSQTHECSEKHYEINANVNSNT